MDAVLSACPSLLAIVDVGIPQLPVVITFL
jgi:hypothetical protein